MSNELNSVCLSVWLLWLKCHLASAFSIERQCAEALSQRAITASADSQPSMGATHLILLALSVITIYTGWMDGGPSAGSLINI